MQRTIASDPRAYGDIWGSRAKNTIAPNTRAINDGMNNSISSSTVKYRN